VGQTDRQGDSYITNQNLLGGTDGRTG